jgi:predicted enzyme related to lactoylglutathione lyase
MQPQNKILGISSIILWSEQLKETLNFYQAIGFVLVEEKHKNGPIHFSSQVGTILLEIYGGEKSETKLKHKEAGSTQLCLAVSSVDEVYANALRIGAPIFSQPRTTHWGRSVALFDPDGRLLELIERPF